MVEIPKIYKKCNLYYESFFIEESFEVPLVEDTIHLITIDTASNLSITIMAVILFIAAVFLSFDEFSVGVALLLLFFTAIVAHPLFTHLGFGLAILKLDLILILRKKGFFHLFARAMKWNAKGVRKRAGEERIYKNRVYENIVSLRDTGAAADDHLELINTIKKYRRSSNKV